MEKGICMVLERHTDSLSNVRGKHSNYIEGKLDSTLPRWSKLTSAVRGRHTVWHPEKVTINLTYNLSNNNKNKEILNAEGEGCSSKTSVSWKTKAEEPFHSLKDPQQLNAIYDLKLDPVLEGKRWQKWDTDGTLQYWINVSFPEVNNCAIVVERRPSFVETYAEYLG